MNCQDIERLLSAKPVGALSPEDRAAVTQHASACAACRAKWQLEFGTGQIRDAVKSLGSEKSVKDGVMDRIQREAAPPPGESASQGQLPKSIGGYELISRIGRGGMGTVFKARQVSIDRIVALKVLFPKLAKNEEFVQRFLREARSAAQLNHPNIVQAYDTGLADGYYCPLHK